MGDTAASRIRASVVALPEHLRQPWQHFNEMVYVEHNGNDLVHAVVDSRVREADGVTAEHIALLASPDVATARLADRYGRSAGRRNRGGCAVSARVYVFQRNGYGWCASLCIDDMCTAWDGWWSERTARRRAGRMLRRFRRDHREAAL